MTDAGMTGDWISHRHGQGRTVVAFPAQTAGLEVRSGERPGDLAAFAVETDDKTGMALKVGAVRLGGLLEEARPSFWN